MQKEAKSWVFTCAVMLAPFILGGIASATIPPVQPGPNSGSNGSILPDQADFGAVRLGTSRVVAFTVRGKTCGELYPYAPSCEGLVLHTAPTNVFPEVRKPFRLVDPAGTTNRCALMVPSSTASGCTVQVAFRPDKRGGRSGLLTTNGFGSIPLRGVGKRPRRSE